MQTLIATACSDLAGGGGGEHVPPHEHSSRGSSSRGVTRPELI